MTCTYEEVITATILELGFLVATLQDQQVFTAAEVIRIIEERQGELALRLKVRAEGQVIR